MQLFALFQRQRTEYVCDHFLRKVRGQIGNLVGVELLGCRQQFFGIHVGNQGLANGIGHLEKNVAVEVGLDQIPHSHAFFERQLLENGSNVCRMKLVEFVFQFRDVLLLYQPLHELLARHVLFVHESLDELMLLQDGAHLGGGICHALNTFIFLVVACFFCHWAKELLVWLWSESPVYIAAELLSFA